MGSIYRRGETLWIKYYRNGKAYRESAKSGKETDARRLLKTREGELAALKAMFNLAAEATPPKVGQVPHIPMLEENNVREGFFEANEYQRVYDALPDHLRPILAFAYHTGWRKAEVIGLTWDRVDTKAGTVRLEARQTKNKKPRTIYLNSTLLALMKEQMKIRQLGCPYVFHRSGEEIRDFRGSWKSACKKAKVKGRLFHDLRRTGVRNNKRAGISETVAMTI